MGHHLDGFAQIVAATLLVNNRLVNSASGNGIVAGGPYARESLVMAQIQVGFHTVHGHIALPMLVGVQRTRVDVDIRVEFLNGDGISA